MSTKCRHCGSTGLFHVGRAMMLAAFCGARCVSGGQNAELPSFAAAERILFPEKDQVVGWNLHQISRGGSSMVYTETTEYDWNGNAIWSNSTLSQSNYSGTILAVPVGDFVVDQMFLYSAGGTCRTGVVASVEIQLSTGSKRATDEALQGAVKNLVCSGMALASSNGGKPSHVMALKKSAARRFGGKNPRVHYDAKEGKVYLLLEDCRDSKSDPTFVPATPDGASKSVRKSLTKLYRDKDKGDHVYVWRITEIHPAGSPHVHDRDFDDENRTIITR